MSILDRHLNTIVDFAIDGAVAGVKLAYRTHKKRKEERKDSTLRAPMEKIVNVDGVPTLITIHPASK